MRWEGLSTKVALAFCAMGLLLQGLLAAQAAAADPELLKEPWAKWDYSKDKPVRGGIYRVAATQYIGKMNPNHWPVLDWVSMGYFHERLMLTDAAYKPTAFWLAKSLTWESPTSVLIKLRNGITFHDGSSFNAHTVKYQFDWIQDPKNGAWSAAWITPLVGTDVVDESTVRMKFNAPWASFASNLSNVPGYMLSEKALQEGGDKFDSDPKGTGAYILEEASPGNYLKFKRNPNWWFAKASGHPDMPYFDGILVSVIPDPAVQLANLRAGKIDVLVLDKSQYGAVRNDPNLNIWRYPQNWSYALRFNTTKGPLKDVRLRQAVSLAIDRKALIAGTQFGLGRPASGPFPDDHWAHNPHLKPVPFDPARAKKLLAEAGYPNGLTLKGFWSNTSAGQVSAEALKAMLANVGIDWQVDLLAPAAQAQRMKDADYDIGLTVWTFVYDPDLLATGLYAPDGGFNFGRSNNAAVIALIDAGRKETDFAKRQQIYWKMEQVLYDSYEDAWLFWDEWAVAYRKSVHGWDQDGFLKYRDVWFWSHPLWFEGGKS